MSLMCNLQAERAWFRGGIRAIMSMANPYLSRLAKLAKYDPNGPGICQEADLSLSIPVYNLQAGVGRRKRIARLACLASRAHVMKPLGPASGQQLGMLLRRMVMRGSLRRAWS